MTISAGRINRLFGTGGGVMLTLYPAFPDDFDPQTPLLVTIDALEVPLYCERFERRGASGATVVFADFDTQRRAQELVGLEFRIGQAEDEDDEDDTFYLEDLIGFAVEAEEMLCEDAGTGIASETGKPTARNGESKNLDRKPTARNGESAAQTEKRSEKYRGTVTNYYDSDLNPLFELEIDGRQVLVPAVEEFIAHIDFEGRTMYLVLPEGLIGLE